MKRCITCRVEKPHGEFYKRKDSPDGYRNDCKACRKKKSTHNYHQDVEKQKKKRRAYYRKFIKKNPDFHLKKYWADVEQSRQQNREYYRQNREQRIQRSVEYARQNRAKTNAAKKKYKLAKARACPPWVHSSSDLCSQMAYFYEEAQRKTEATGTVHHVDHIVPLRGETICGLHVPWNLQVLTASENCSKQNRVLGELTSW